MSSCINLIIVLIALFLQILCIIQLKSNKINSEIPTQTNGIQYFYNLSSLAIPNKGVINIEFQYLNTSILSKTFIMISFQDKYKVGNISIRDFYGKSYRDYEGIMDLIGHRQYKKQYINLQKKSQFNVLYLTVFNFDSSSRNYSIHFQLNIVTFYYWNLYNCFSCNGGTRISKSCVCQNCPYNLYGEDCSIEMQLLTPQNSYKKLINKAGIYFFKIQQADQIKLSIKKTSIQSIAQVYLQYITYQGEVAAYSNVAIIQGSQAIYKLISKEKQINFSANGIPISLTIAFYNNIQTEIQIYYESQITINVVVVILSVLGGVLFVAFVIALIYIIKKNNTRATDRIQSGAVIHNIIQQAKLRDDQIQRFFPSISMKFIMENSYTNDISTTSFTQIKKQLQNQECVICLCPIQEIQQVKLTYCRHIFHSHCLIGWFSRHQNCPYCRENFNRINTIKLYKRLKQKNQNKAIKNETLIKAILDNKIQTKNVKQIQEKSINKQTQYTSSIQLISNSS